MFPDFILEAYFCVNEAAREILILKVKYLDALFEEKFVVTSRDLIAK